MKTTILLLILTLPFILKAQEETRTESGRFSLGVRTTTSLFNHETESAGLGSGGQFRIQVNKRVNTEWFADYITSGIGNFANRKDGHIGWSVMLYMDNTPQVLRTLTPYLLAGHCFDYTKVSDNGNPGNAMSRWSSAVQMGAGSHYNFTERFDLSFNAQYMIHLGNEIEATLVEGYKYSPSYVAISKSTGNPNLEGHLLLSLTMNYRIADLNKKK